MQQASKLNGAIPRTPLQGLDLKRFDEQQMLYDTGAKTSNPFFKFIASHVGLQELPDNLRLLIRRGGKM